LQAHPRSATRFQYSSSSHLERYRSQHLDRRLCTAASTSCALIPLFQIQRIRCAASRSAPSPSTLSVRVGGSDSASSCVCSGRSPEQKANPRQRLRSKLASPSPCFEKIRWQARCDQSTLRWPHATWDWQRAAVGHLQRKQKCGWETERKPCCCAAPSPPELLLRRLDDAQMSIGRALPVTRISIASATVSLRRFVSPRASNPL